MIIKNIFNGIITIVFIVIVTFQIQTNASEISSSSSSIGLKTNILAELKYEVKEPTSLQNPVTDPNFNVMRKQELGKSKAIPLVVGVLIVAIVAPIATWMYFSN